MTVRPLKSSDVPILQEMARKSGFPYPDFSSDQLGPARTCPNVEAVVVVADDDDRPIMACAAKKLVELYLWCGEFERPHAKVFALRMLHEEMAKILKAKGYSSAEAFLPPTLAQRFARRLGKTFGWRPNWPSWTHDI